MLGGGGGGGGVKEGACGVGGIWISGRGHMEW